jgi:hypothetical protein
MKKPDDTGQQLIVLAQQMAAERAADRDKIAAERAELTRIQKIRDELKAEIAEKTPLLKVMIRGLADLENKIGALRTQFAREQEAAKL